MNLFWEIMIFVLGLIVGSFINMAVYRVGKKKSFFDDKRSYCDFCKKQLHWFDNIPVLSWLIYGGKSRCCKKKLPISYPIIEILTGVLFLFNFIFFETNYWILIFNFLIIGLLVFETLFDFKYMMLPDVTAYSLIVLAVIRWLIMGASQSYFISALISGIFIYILHKIKIRGHEAMGDGDILLAVFMGMFLGFPNILIAFYIAFIVGAIVGVILIYGKKIGRMTPIPFGPFLIFGTLVAYWWGEKLVNMFFNYL